MTTINLLNVVRLLAVALNPTTPRNEAHAAERKARELGRSDGTVASLLGSLDTIREANLQLAAKVAEQENEIAALQARNRALDSEATALRAEIFGLESENTGLKTALSDTGRSYMPFAGFAARACAVYGRKTWKSAFAFEAGVPVKELNAWQTVDLIPADWAAKLEALTKEQRKSASRQPWSDTECARLRQAVEEGLRDFEIARLLTAELGRRRFETNTAAQRRRLAREGGWTPRSAAGKRGGAGANQHAFQ